MHMSESFHSPLSSFEDDYRNPIEGTLHEFLDELCTVAIQSRSSITSKWESYLSYVKGVQWPSSLPDYKSDFTLNLIGTTIKRKAAYLTDTKPIIDIVPRDIALQPMAEILQLLVRGLWDERAVLSALTRCLYMAQIFGPGIINLIWDEDLDFGNGEVNFIPLDPRHFLMDPGIVTAEDLQQAEYIILEGVYPLNLLKALYPKEASQIKADPKYSKYSTYTSTEEESLSSPSSRPQRRPLKTGNVSLSDSSIPRAIVQEFWIKDRILFKDLSEKNQKLINAQLEAKNLSPKQPEDRVWPGGRHIIRAGGKILRDESNPYFDLQFPCEMMSWGMAIEHPWGKSEVEEVMHINTVINKIGASMVENTLLMNNNLWIGDSNALLPEQWEKLTNKPGLTVKKRPGSQLERSPAPALPGSTFALQQWLVQMMQDVTGMQDVLQGKAGNQTTGVAIEALQCVDIETECLTHEGWKKYEQIKQDDLLYSIDPNNGKAQWSKILDLHSYYHTGELYSLKSQDIDALVTSNHAWYVTSRDNALPYRRIETKDLLPSHYIPLEHSSLAVEDIEVTQVPHIGKVWCPTTETGTWLARRNGKTFFTGNSQSQALLRLQARHMEVFLERLGQKLISRILQFYSPEKIINILGPNPKLLSFEFHRDEIISKIKGVDPRKAFQDFIFRVEPLSSLTMSKMQKLISMSNLYSMGLVPGKEVLKAAQIQDPEGTLEEARVEQAAKMAPAGSPIKPDAPDPSQQKPGPGGQ